MLVTTFTAYSYPCILADPPWPERGGGKIKRGADAKYEVLGKSSNTTTAPEILQVMVTAPCWKPGPNAHLWLWVTNNYLQAGLWLMGALGFRYVTNIAWGKAETGTYQTTKRGVRREAQLERLARPQHAGLGQYLGGQHELLLFGVRGRLAARWKVTRGGRPGTLLLAPRRAHSEKPVEVYTVIEAVSVGPRLEMFARARRDGWDAWGDEAR